MEETHVERISDDSEPSEDDCEEELVLAMPKRKGKDLAPVWIEAGTKLFENGQIIGGVCKICFKKYKSSKNETL